MTLPAARAGDSCAHGGTILPPGSPTVLIGNMPAARLGDMHVCPMLTGVVPHVGGPIIVGSPTVLIGGLPAARATDLATCTGPPDVIIGPGSPMTLIGLGAAAAPVICSLAGSPAAATQVFPGVAADSTVAAIQQALHLATGAPPPESVVRTAAKLRTVPGGIPRDALPAILRDLAGSRVSVRSAPAGTQGIADGLDRKAIVLAPVDGAIFGDEQAGKRETVLVTGVLRDQKGAVVAVIVNDTVNGIPARPVGAEQFDQATKDQGDCVLVVGLG